MRALLFLSVFFGLPAAAVGGGVRGPGEIDQDPFASVVRELQGRCDDGNCNQPTLSNPNNDDDWCDCVGGTGAFAIPDRQCYDDFASDCQCENGYFQTNGRCVFCNRANPSGWCVDELGSGAQHKAGESCWYEPALHCECRFDHRLIDGECVDCNFSDKDAWCRTFSSVASAHGGRDCYDDFEEDCYCPSNYRQTDDGCEQCNRDNPTQWCQRVGGPRAFHRGDRDCWTDFEDDCRCEHGFQVDGERCVTCNLDNPDQWCGRFYTGATAIPNQDCYDDFEDDCKCPEGFEADGDTCEVDCHDSDPDEFCRDQGGQGAFANEDLDCWTDFEQHCECFEQFDKQSDGCVNAPPRFTGNRVYHVGNDDRPRSAYPMQRCQGDCDSDSDCAEGLTCYMRDSFEPVPGCVGGEDEREDYDYCIGPPTEAPTDVPTPLVTPNPTMSSPRPTLRPTNPPTPTPDPTTASPTPRPTDMTMLRPVNMPMTPQFIIPMPPTGGGTMYDVRYVGRFQKVQEPGCTFPSPEVTVGCVGSVGMVATSDPSIVCGSPTVGTDGSSTVVCNNTCVGEACEAIFLGSTFDGDFGDLRLFGEVYFQCMGPDITDVAGWVSVAATGQGSCEADAMIDNGIGAAFQTAQMGVYGMMVDNYVFDDSLFECNTDSLSVSLSGVYSCTFGNACFDDACLFSMEALNVTADIHRFPTQFIRANDRSVLPDVPDPMNGVAVTGSRTALFQVNSGFYYDEAACSGTVSGLRMTCLDGTITLVENQGNMACSTQGTNVIQCDEVATAVNPRNEYTRVLRYECTATDRVPQTTVANTASSVECTSATEQQVSLELQLGAVCMGGNVMYDDFFYECGEQSALISRVGEFTCGIAGVVPVGVGPVGFATASVETDFRWGTMGSEMCLSEATVTNLGGLLTSSISSSTILEKQAANRKRPTKTNPDTDLFP